MLVNNGKKRLIGASGNTYALSKQKYIAIDGTEYTGATYNNDWVGAYAYQYTVDANVSNGSIVIGLGGGTTPVSENDYNLANKYADNLFETVTGNSAADAYTNGTFTPTKTLRYIGTDPITITEVGLFFNHRNDKWFLEAREVLDTPLTVSNGDIFTVTMIIG